ncbi:MAG: class I tRNA ligase family protein, partial [Chloroflexi bacterium]|nr:class I tRNA ligase family protein [Chloroflexota bacterium]
ALRDIGLLDFGEPFLRLFNQGVILGEDHDKMSKSKGNVVAPDEYVDTLGADVVRIYLMFLGPWDQGGPWSTAGINGMARWANRVWDLALRDSSEFRSPDPAAVRDLVRATHKTIRKVMGDLDAFRFNTALASLMELSNALGDAWESRNVDAAAWDAAVDALLVLLAPCAPHITEELWERRGRPYSIHQQPLPKWDAALAADEEITLVVQVNGRVRDRLTVPAGITEADAKAAALASPKVQGYATLDEVIRSVYVPGKLLNLITNQRKARWDFIDDATDAHVAMILADTGPEPTGTRYIDVVPGCPSWIITRTENPHQVDFSVSPPQIIFRVYGHCEH